MSVLLGDCVARTRELDAESIDAVVTDPPYFLSFMGRDWDRAAARVAQERHERWAVEALGVLKPDGHLLAFGGTRTFHRLACAIEDAGFEVRDCLMFMYGSGFPKSLDVSKAIDKAAGAERVKVAVGTDGAHRRPRAMAPGGAPREAVQSLSNPVTPDAEDWRGWGTALKPAWEPIVVARKPLAGTVAGVESRFDGESVGVWACVPGCPVRALDDQTGVLTSGRLLSHHQRSGGSQIGTFAIRDRTGEPSDFGGDQGGASRFFYCAKASRAERDAGLDGFAEHRQTVLNAGVDGSLPRDRPNLPRANVHPTVKPIDLVRLVTPPGGLILDPFAGSGTTGCAAALEGFEFVGIERDPEYVRIAEARIRFWAEHPTGLPVEVALAADTARRRVRESGQAGLFE